MWRREDSSTVRLRERMRDAQAEMDKTQEADRGVAGLSASKSEVERLLLCRETSRELHRILGSR